VQKRPQQRVLRAARQLCEVDDGLIASNTDPGRLSASTDDAEGRQPTVGGVLDHL
jgi:hypothetical protein